MAVSSRGGSAPDAARVALNVARREGKKACDSRSDVQDFGPYEAHIVKTQFSFEKQIVVVSGAQYDPTVAEGTVDYCCKPILFTCHAVGCAPRAWPEGLEGELPQTILSAPPVDAPVEPYLMGEDYFSSTVAFAKKPDSQSKVKKNNKVKVNKKNRKQSSKKSGRSSN
jgi:hypothetical protein